MIGNNVTKVLLRGDKKLFYDTKTLYVIKLVRTYVTFVQKAINQFFSFFQTWTCRSNVNHKAARSSKIF